MRLVDAEQLKQAVRKKFPELADRCEINELVNAAPTVDAISIEWMVSWINRHPNDLRGAWFVSLEMEWRKEREADYGCGE